VRVVWGRRDLAEPFILHMTGLTRPFGPCQTALVVNGDNEMVAALAFHNFDPDAGVMECSAAAADPKWASRGVLNELMDYVFGTNGCQMLVARTAPDNDRVRRLWKVLGAQEYVIPRLRGRDKDEAILCVTDDAWATSKLKR